MKKLFLLLAVCLLVSGCGKAPEQNTGTSSTAVPESSSPAVTYAAVEFKIAVKGGEAIINNEDVADIIASLSAGGSTWEVQINLTKTGADKMRSYTEENLGEQVYLYLDGEVISILGVTSVISDSFSVNALEKSDALALANGV